MTYNYSFIIPHKNCPVLLQRCVNSIPERDDVQIIVVDDNSDADQKPSINRKGVKVVLLDADHSKGAGRARNVGLEYAEGKWLLFADSDDYYTDYLSTLLDKYSEDDTTDIVYLNACMFDERDNVLPYRSNQFIHEYLSGAKEGLMHLKYSLWTPWTRMVKKEMILKYNIWFDEIPAGNDVMFGLKCSRFASTMCVDYNIVYKYFKSSQGSVTDKARKGMAEDRLDLLGCKINFLKEVNYHPIPSLFQFITMMFFRRSISREEIITIYVKYLRKHDISLCADLRNYLLGGELKCSLLFHIRKLRK